MKHFLLGFLLVISFNSYSKLSSTDLFNTWNLIQEEFKDDFIKNNELFTLELVDPEVEKFVVVYPGTPNRILLSKSFTEIKNLKKEHILNLLCHEVGHMIAGSPFIEEHIDDDSESAQEGQCDYFATLKCMRRILKNDKETKDYVKKISSEEISDILARGCKDNKCIRIVHSSYEWIKIMNPTESVSLKQYSKDVVEFTPSRRFEGSAQCKLDTNIAGAICPIPTNIPLERYREGAGTCHASSPNPLEVLGARPACWYKSYL